MDNTRNWEEELIKYGLDWAHPEFTEEEKFIMDLAGAGQLRRAEPDKRNEAPRYLVLREAIRRHVKGYTKHPNNYAKLAVRAYERIQDDIMDKSGIGLLGTYSPQVNEGDGEPVEGDGRTDWQRFLDSKGPFSPEELIIIKRIYALRKEWVRTSYREGRHLMNLGTGDPGTVRKKWLRDGTAAKMIIKHQLPVEFFKNYLLSDYSPQEQPEDETTDDKPKVTETKSWWSWVLKIFNWK